MSICIFEMLGTRGDLQSRGGGGGEESPRCIDANLPRESVEKDALGHFEPRTLYEDFNCAAGDMGNVIKQQQLDLGADRTSTTDLDSNQLRLCFSTFA